MTDQVETKIPIIEQEWVVREPSTEAPEPVREEISIEIPAEAMEGIVEGFSEGLVNKDISTWETSIGIPPDLKPGTYITITLDTEELVEAIDEFREKMAEQVVDFKRVAMLGRQAMAWNIGPSCRCALCTDMAEMAENIEQSVRALALCTPGRNSLTGQRRAIDNLGMVVTLE